MTRILAFSALVLLFFAFEGSFFIQNSAISSYSFLFLEPSGNLQIIFGGGYIFSEALYLNRGADDGAEAGDLIVYGKNIAVGKIVEVFPKFSKVAPFSKFGEKTVELLGRKNTHNSRNYSILLEISHLLSNINHCMAYLHAVLSILKG